jgi:hypothetical protein
LGGSSEILKLQLDTAGIKTHIKNVRGLTRIDQTFASMSLSQQIAAITALVSLRSEKEAATGLADFPINRIGELTPGAWAARSS